MAPSADCLRELMACSILVAKDVIAEALGSEELVDSNELRGIVTEGVSPLLVCNFVPAAHQLQHHLCGAGGPILSSGRSFEQACVRLRQCPKTCRHLGQPSDPRSRERCVVPVLIRDQRTSSPASLVASRARATGNSPNSIAIVWIEVLLWDRFCMTNSQFAEV